MYTVRKPQELDSLTNCIFTSNNTNKFIKINNLIFTNKYQQIDQNILLANKSIRELLHVTENKSVDLKIEFSNIDTPILQELTVTCQRNIQNSDKIKIEHKQLVDKFLLLNHGILFCKDHRGFLIVPECDEHNKKYIKYSIDEEVNGILNETTLIKFISVDSYLTFDTKEKSISKEIDLKTLGIGGLDEQFSILYRRAFMLFGIDYKILEQLNIKRPKGILLYGPPGTGKTLMARQLSNLLNCRDIQIVSGP